MDSNVIADGVIQYLMLVALLTFHEYGHAWTAWKCGDDTARLQGRVSLNPVVHIDPIGTVALPLLMIFLSPSIGRFLIGWAKPVPVNPYNFNKPKRDDILVTMAGPAMNLILAVGLVALARVGIAAHSEPMIDFCLRGAALSLILCFFNLIPIPPLDGSKLFFSVFPIRMEMMIILEQFGFVILLFFIIFFSGPLGIFLNFMLNLFLGIAL